MKIAFDLDGVLLPDYNFIPKLDLLQFYEQTLHAKPLFHPQYVYDVVTARSEDHRELTEKWLTQMDIYPTNIFMNTENISPAEFKYKVIRANEYDMYVESDVQICKDIAAMFEQDEVADPPHIIHFGIFVGSRLYEVASGEILF
jgi:uncharacterized HAD superfamily protein